MNIHSPHQLSLFSLPAPEGAAVDWTSRDVVLEAAASRAVHDTVGFEALLREGRRYLVVPISFNGQAESVQCVSPPFFFFFSSFLFSSFFAIWKDG